MTSKFKPEWGAALLELGAGGNPAEGYVHQDIRPLEHIEIVCDMREIVNYIEPGWRQIKMAHCLEHFSPIEGIGMLKICHSLLVAGGGVVIDVPNLSWQTSAHHMGIIDDMEAVYYIYGEQDYEENTHKNGFTEKTLTDALTQAGFDANVNNIGQVLIGIGVKHE